ncbi:hypothetical protein [Treponema porcinum]|uniref:hypothetical protein n=1 Tax=Treponema porcinum TaxID=261392 RepID=UPI002A81FF4F|nr:hypothetical protein [Treponema porcinum]MDD7697954.1 hypothetical protein [Spirochaetia bacterium]MDY4467370.1 hypothetical protein [Treponema porcinum]
MKKIILSVLAVSQILLFSCNKNQKTVITAQPVEIQEQEEKIDFSEKPKVRTVEIVSMEYASGVASSDVATLKAKIIEGLSNRKNVRVIDRSRMNDVLNEHQKQQSLWASDDGKAEVGRQYNANALVYLEAINKNEIQVTIEDLDTFQQVVKLVNISNVSEIANWDLAILSL